MKGSTDANPSTPPSGGSGSGSSSTDYSSMPKKSNTSMWVAVIVVIAIVIGLAGYGAGAGWFGGKSSSSNSGGFACTAGSLAGEGSTFVYPLVNAWALTYAQSCGTQVSYAFLGSGAGVSALTAKTVDFGASDAPLTPSQTTALPHSAFTIPETIGAVTVMYNIPGVAKGLNLTGNIVAGIYLGSITNWNVTAITSINPGVKIPNQSVHVIYRTGSSGTSFVFTTWLSASNHTWNTTLGHGTSVAWPVGTGATGSNGVAGTVASTPGAIGYAELNYAALGGNAYAKLLNPAGAYALPTANSTAAAAAAVASHLPLGSASWANVSMINEPGMGTYPLATFSYYLVYSDLGSAVYPGGSMAHANSLVQWLWWCVHTGQTQAPALFYVPLPAAVVTLDEQTIGEITYNGASLTSH
jgi:phosphate transport system substrate-binding protein